MSSLQLGYQKASKGVCLPWAIARVSGAVAPGRKLCPGACISTKHLPRGQAQARGLHLFGLEVSRDLK